MTEEMRHDTTRDELSGGLVGDFRDACLFPLRPRRRPSGEASASEEDGSLPASSAGGRQVVSDNCLRQPPPPPLQAQVRSVWTAQFETREMKG